MASNGLCQKQASIWAVMSVIRYWGVISHAILFFFFYFLIIINNGLGNKNISFFYLVFLLAIWDKSVITTYATTLDHRHWRSLLSLQVTNLLVCIVAALHRCITFFFWWSIDASLGGFHSALQRHEFIVDGALKSQPFLYSYSVTNYNFLQYFSKVV